MLTLSSDDDSDDSATSFHACESLVQSIFAHSWQSITESVVITMNERHRFHGFIRHRHLHLIVNTAPVRSYLLAWFDLLDTLGCSGLVVCTQQPDLVKSWLYCGFQLVDPVVWGHCSEAGWMLIGYTQEWI